MSDASFAIWDDQVAAPAGPKSRPRHAPDWPLIGDVATHRAGIPEHLIRWKRAVGEDDPPPAL